MKKSIKEAGFTRLKRQILIALQKDISCNLLLGSFGHLFSIYSTRREYK